VRFHATKIACSNPLVARLTEKKAGLFTHVVVGLDPDANLSRQIALEIIIPGLRKSGAGSATYLACARIAVSLHLDPSLVTEISFELVNRIRSCSIQKQDQNLLRCQQHLKDSLA
jgi:hypothetical protein